MRQASTRNCCISSACMQTDFLFERRLNDHLFGVIAEFSKGEMCSRHMLCRQMISNLPATCLDELVRMLLQGNRHSSSVGTHRCTSHELLLPRSGGCVDLACHMTAPCLTSAHARVHARPQTSCKRTDSSMQAVGRRPPSSTAPHSTSGCRPASPHRCRLTSRRSCMQCRHQVHCMALHATVHAAHTGHCITASLTACIPCFRCLAGGGNSC